MLNYQRVFFSSDFWIFHGDMINLHHFSPWKLLQIKEFSHQPWRIIPGIVTVRNQMGMGQN